MVIGHPQVPLRQCRPGSGGPDDPADGGGLDLRLPATLGILVRLDCVERTDVASDADRQQAHWNFYRDG